MVEQLISAFIHCATALFLYATVLFIISVRLKRNDIADVAWGLAYVIVSIIMLVIGYVHTLSLVVFSLTILWGLRLSIHIYQRNKNKSEDFRYKKWREEWGKSFYWRSYLQVYLLQCFLVITIATPIIFIASVQSSEFSYFTVIGVLTWLIGFYFQAIGDYQLREFSKNKKESDSFIQSGLWKYTRHPNYFGEIVMWWSILIIVAPAQYGIYSAIGPVTITLLIRYVSGAPMLEEKYNNNQAYQKYKREVPILIPKFW